MINLPATIVNPSETIVPLFGVDESDTAKLGKYIFLGTGVFVGKQPLLATAEHVVRGWKQSFAITTLPNTSRMFSAKVVTTDRATDLALLEVAGYPPEKALELANDDEIVQNQLVSCFEYSTTQAKQGIVVLAPATRLGNVTRIIDLSDRYGKAGKDALELSFPALRGASGAPVISSTFHVWGIVIANVSYHLLPVQIESVLDEKNQLIEETRYLLPQAVAVHVKHLRAILE